MVRCVSRSCSALLFRVSSICSRRRRTSVVKLVTCWEIETFRYASAFLLSQVFSSLFQYLLCLILLLILFVLFVLHHTFPSHPLLYLCRSLSLYIYYIYIYIYIYYIYHIFNFIFIFTYIHTRTHSSFYLVIQVRNVRKERVVIVLSLQVVRDQ